MTMLGGLQIYMLSLIYKWLYGYIPDSKVYGAHMGPTWGRQDPGWPLVGPVMLAIWDLALQSVYKLLHFEALSMARISMA